MRGYTDAMLQLLVFCAFLGSSYSQTPECPDPWIGSAGSCYLFSDKVMEFDPELEEGSELMTWDDAKIQCAKWGAQLISVNSAAEDQILDVYFKANDNTEPSEWYIGATASGNDWTWEDGRRFGSDTWWRGTQDRDGIGNHVLYRYHDQGLQVQSPRWMWERTLGNYPAKYICEVKVTNAGNLIKDERDFIFGADNIHPDKIFRGPYFVTQPQDTFFHLSVDPQACIGPCDVTTSFECDASGYPQPTYEWFEDRNSGTILVEPSSRPRFTITNGRLTIHNPVKELDVFAYWCKAHNQFGTVRSEAGRINYISLEEFPKTQKTVPAKEWDSAVIVCDHTNPSNTRLTFSWFLNNDPTNHVSSVYNNHVFASASGSLYFGSVFLSDAADYHCSIQLEGIEGEGRSSPAYKLEVMTNPNFTPIGPLIHNDFPRIIPERPMKGDRVFLECFARFTSKTAESPIYTWSRVDGRPIPDSYEITDYNRRMIIPNVDFADEGVYRCISEFRSAGDSADITLEISAKPFFGANNLENQHLDEGQRFDWTCHAKGKPEPTYRWLKNGVRLDTNLPADADGRISFSTDMKTISFASVKKASDSGMYQCVAINTHGTTYSTAQMRILEFAPSFTKRPMLGKVIATEGANATIPCDPEAAPEANIQWFFKGAEIAINTGINSPIRKLLNGHLYIDRVTEGTNAGVYTCVASNQIINKTSGEPSKASQTISLEVLRGSRLAYGPRDTTALLGSEVKLECRADFEFVLDLVYLWYHNERLIDFDDWKMTRIYQRGEGVNRGDLIIKSITYEERGFYKCSGHTRSDAASLWAKVTVVGPPGEPAGVKASNPTNHTIDLKWSPGAENGKSISAYYVEKYNSDTREWVPAKNITGEALGITNTTVRDLFANTNYKFRVKAENEYGVGVPSKESGFIKTNPDKPTSAPLIKAGYGGGKEGTLVINFIPLPKEQWNADKVWYRVQYKEYDPNANDEAGNWATCGGGLIAHDSPKAGSCVKTLGSNYFDRPYKARVRAENGPWPSPGGGTENYIGPWSDTVIIRSAVSVPKKAPQNIEAQPFNATALTVNWDPVPNERSITGGELLGFHIQYWKLTSTRSFARRNTIFGNVTEGLIIGLEPNTDYKVTAQLFNSAGDGTTGSEPKQTTWMKAPQNMPEYVTLNKTADNVIGVHFKGVTTGPDEEPLDGYKVRIWRQGESLRNAKDYDCGRRTWIMIEDNFEKTAFYNLRVFGYSRGGVGKMSSPLIQFTIGCNRIPTNPEAQWVYLCDGCSNSVSYLLLLCVSLAHLFRQIL